MTAAAGSWPRISPAAFVGVCTFTYARPDSSAPSSDAFLTDASGEAV
jgi:hypothetical protein